MRFLLALLTCFLFLHAQTYAISAGPVFESGGGNTNTTGTYAGLLVPDDSNSDTTGNTSDSSGTNSLGLFTLSVPSTGLGTGQFVIFAGGLSFTGTITGFGDPDKGQINGVLDASVDLTDNTFSDGFFTYTFGNNDATARASGNIRATLGSGSGTSIARLTGSADVTVQIPQTSPTVTDENGNTTGGVTTYVTTSFDYTVDGIQQSTIALPSSGSLGNNS